MELGPVVKGGDFVLGYLQWLSHYRVFFFFLVVWLRCMLLDKDYYFVWNFLKVDFFVLDKISWLDLIFFSFTIGNFCF